MLYTWQSAVESRSRSSAAEIRLTMRRIAPSKGDVAGFQSDEPAVGDGDAVGISAEIAQGMFGATEGSLGVDHPVMAEESSQPCLKRAWFGQMHEASMKLQCAGVKGSLELVDELAAEDAAEYLERQKEAAGRADPFGVIWRHPACSQHTMDMRVKLQTLIPSVLKKPISAPRWRGSRATSNSVSALE